MKKIPCLSLFLSVLLIFSLTSTSNQAIAPLPDSVLRVLASREMRYHHLLFHNIRNVWNRLDSFTQNRIANLGWRPPRPATDSNGRALLHNDSGEDFLFMHRNMIAIINRLMNQAGLPNITSFGDIPAANDPNLPMPPAYQSQSFDLTNTIRYYKSERWYSFLKNEEARLKNPRLLRTVTLGQLGAYIEWISDLHQGLHFRFSSGDSLMRPRTSDIIPNVDSRYDDPRDNWLIDLYSSHVNPWFWKLHGWIDDRINDWARANGITRIRWKGTWTGGLTSNLPNSLNIPDDPNVRVLGEDMDMGNHTNHTEHGGHAGMDHGAMGMNLTAMEEVAKILVEHGVNCDFYSDLHPGQENISKKWINSRKETRN